MHNPTLAVVIMAGGKGERFWPESRASFPKQFLPLAGDVPLLRQTVDRVLPVAPAERIYVVTGAAYQALVAKTLPDIPAENILIEPVGRNTAPCIGWAARVLEANLGPDAVMAVLPSDHCITKAAEFRTILQAAALHAHTTGDLVTLGIEPSRPETGYGYIEYGDEITSIAGQRCHSVRRFVEKPNLEKACEFLEAGCYLWNSGMFIWRVDAILAAICKHLPDLAAGLIRILPVTQDGGASLDREFPRLPAISIDYGIMEKANHISVFPCDIGWDDVGSWPALERVRTADANGNVTIGRHVGVRTHNTIVVSRNNRLVTTLGVSDLIIVESDGVLFICPRAEAQNVREIVTELRKQGLEDCV